MGRSEIRYRKGDLDGVISDSTKAIELNPALAEAWNNRALARQEKGDLDGALPDYDRSVQLNAKVASTYYNRGGARYLKGDFEGAIADQTQALKLDSGFANAYGDRALGQRRCRRCPGRFQPCHRCEAEPNHGLFQSGLRFPRERRFRPCSC
jgi:tetratricopeptide (TPR) repeat protein